MSESSLPIKPREINASLFVLQRHTVRASSPTRELREWNMLAINECLASHMLKLKHRTRKMSTARIRLLFINAIISLTYPAQHAKAVIHGAYTACSIRSWAQKEVCIASSRR